DTCPDFLPTLVFAYGLAVVEDIGWCVGHTHVVIDTAFTVRDWQRVSIRCHKPEASEVLQGPAGRFQHTAQSPAGQCVTAVVVVDQRDAAIRVAIDAATGAGLPFQQKPVTPQGTDEFAHGCVAQGVHELGQVVGHRVTATSGASTVSTVCASGIG